MKTKRVHSKNVIQIAKNNAEIRAMRKMKIVTIVFLIGFCIYLIAFGNPC